MNRYYYVVSALVSVLLGSTSIAAGEVIVRRGDVTIGRTYQTPETEQSALTQVSAPARRDSSKSVRIGTGRANERAAQKREAAAQSSGMSSSLAGLPANDSCATPEAIAGEGAFAFDNTDATADGPMHDACIDAFDPVGSIAHDVWFCWTSPCTGAVEITTCGQTGVDTKIAVYGSCNATDGSPNCPPTDDDLFPFGCNDDDEGGFGCGLESSATILATAGESYLIRVGTYPGDPNTGFDPAPGGPGALQITCVDLPCEHANGDGKCQDYHRFSGTGTNGVDFRVADDFTAVETGEITELCWWGSYLYDIWDPNTWPETFEIRYYADQGGVPGALIGGPFVQRNGTLSVGPAVDTGAGDAFRVFEYTAVHGGTCSISGSPCDVWGPACRNVCEMTQEECGSDADCTEPDDTCSVVQTCNPIGVPVTAGSCYWIEIVNNTDPNAWFWQDGVGGDIASVQAGDTVCAISNEPCSSNADCVTPGDTCIGVLPDGYDLTDVIPNDLAFCLNVNNESCNDSPCAGATGDCCEFEPISTPGCEDPACCALVCACDPVCCSPSGWDEFCQGNGFGDTGCGAAALCADTCATCPDGTVSFLDPLADPVQHPDGLVDARQPSPINGGGPLQGFQSFFVEAPLGASTATVGGCWSLCETGDTVTPNSIDSIVSHADGTYTIHLERPITPGELTTLTYLSDTGVIVTERFAALPGDSNSDRLVNAQDVNYLIDCLNGVTPAPCDAWQTDIDRSEVSNPQDILRLIDLLNGAGDFDIWLTRTVGTECPLP